jgi:hypothetical protein
MNATPFIIFEVILAFAALICVILFQHKVICDRDKRYSKLQNEHIQLQEEYATWLRAHKDTLIQANALIERAEPLLKDLCHELD